MLCNDAGKGVLKSRIIEALQELNKEWNFSSCNTLTESDCDDLGVNINCQRNAGGSSSSDNNQVRRIKRQIAQQNGGGDDQTYQLEIQFPTIDNDEVTNGEGKRERLQRLIESIILEQNKLDVNDTLPNVQLDKSSFAIEKQFTCDEGEVVSDNDCGK